MQSLNDIRIKKFFAKVADSPRKTMQIAAEVPKGASEVLRDYRKALCGTDHVKPIKKLQVNLLEASDSDRAAVERVVRGWIPCEFTFGHLRAWEQGDTAIIGVEVESPQLHDLAGELRSRVSVVNRAAEQGLYVGLAEVPLDFAYKFDGLSLDGTTGAQTTFDAILCGVRRIAMMGAHMPFSDRLVSKACTAQYDHDGDGVICDGTVDEEVAPEKAADPEESGNSSGTQDKENGDEPRNPEASGSQTDTPEFKAWFGDSKVVDENGKPLVVYHGTDEEFTEFDRFEIGSAQDGKLFGGQGFYFADKKSDASGYGNKVLQVYLRMSNPLDLTSESVIRDQFTDVVPRGQDKPLGQLLDDYNSASESLDIEDILVSERRPGFMDVQAKVNGDWVDLTPRSAASSLELSEDPTGRKFATRKLLPRNPREFLSPNAFTAQQIDDVIESGGFDGSIIPSSIGHTGDREYIVFDPDQIKSATGNEGTFDPSNPDITKAFTAIYTKACDAQYDHDGDGVICDGTPDEEVAPESGQNPEASGQGSQRKFSGEPDRESGQRLTRLTVNGRGLLNNGVLDRMQLTDDEEAELNELMDFGLQQPRGVDADGVFYFTDEGLEKHARMIELLEKAAKGPVSREEITGGDVMWESQDGQVAIREGSQVTGEPQNQTDTPQFKRWFGDSKVVDENGEPLVVYHGTDEEFTTFEQRGGTVSILFGSYEVERSGFFFSPSEDDAGTFGDKVMPVHLSIQNPADMTTYEGNAKVDEILIREGFNERWLRQSEAWELFDGEDGKELVAALKRNGFDGALIEEPWVEGVRDQNVAWIAFEPTQIKSATGNQGTFDSSDPDITKHFDAIYTKACEAAYDHDNDGVICDGTPDEDVAPEKADRKPDTASASADSSQPDRESGQRLSTEDRIARIRELENATTEAEVEELNALLREDYEARGTSSEGFKRWFGDWEKDPENASKVVGENGEPLENHAFSQAVDEDGEPIVVFHGTTHEFDRFMNQDHANAENSMGIGHYFSTERFDAGDNYAGEGPDLKNRIVQRQEQMEYEIEDDAQSFSDALEEKIDAEELDPDTPEGKQLIDDLLIEHLDDWTGDAETHGEIVDAITEKVKDGASNFSASEIAEEIARAELSGGEPRTITAYLNVRNPVIMNGNGHYDRSAPNTRFEIETVDDQDYKDEKTDEMVDAVVEAMNHEGLEVSDETKAKVQPILDEWRKYGKEYSPEELWHDKMKDLDWDAEVDFREDDVWSAMHDSVSDASPEDIAMEWSDSRYESQEQSGNGVDLIESLQRLNWQYDLQGGEDSIHELIDELRMGESVTADSVLEAINNAMPTDYDNHNGAIVGGEAFAEIMRDLGFDGIRDMIPQQRFKGMSIGSYTEHWIVWDANQIKAKENEGTFDPGDDRFMKGLFDRIITKTWFDAIVSKGCDAAYDHDKDGVKCDGTPDEVVVDESEQKPDTASASKDSGEPDKESGQEQPETLAEPTDDMTGPQKIHRVAQIIRQNGWERRSAEAMELIRKHNLSSYTVGNQVESLEAEEVLDSPHMKAFTTEYVNMAMNGQDMVDMETERGGPYRSLSRAQRSALHGRVLKQMIDDWGGPEAAVEEMAVMGLNALSADASDKRANPDRRSAVSQLSQFGRMMEIADSGRSYMNKNPELQEQLGLINEMYSLRDSVYEESMSIMVEQDVMETSDMMHAIDTVAMYGSSNRDRRKNRTAATQHVRERLSAMSDDEMKGDPALEKEWKAREIIKRLASDAESEAAKYKLEGLPGDPLMQNVVASAAHSAERKLEKDAKILQGSWLRTEYADQANLLWEAQNIARREREQAGVNVIMEQRELSGPESERLQQMAERARVAIGNGVSPEVEEILEQQITYWDGRTAALEGMENLPQYDENNTLIQPAFMTGSVNYESNPDADSYNERMPESWDELDYYTQERIEEDYRLEYMNDSGMYGYMQEQAQNEVDEEQVVRDNAYYIAQSESDKTEDDVLEAYENGEDWVMDQVPDLVQSEVDSMMEGNWSDRFIENEIDQNRDQLLQNAIDSGMVDLVSEEIDVDEIESNLGLSRMDLADLIGAPEGVTVTAMPSSQNEGGLTIKVNDQVCVDEGCFDITMHREVYDDGGDIVMSAELFKLGDDAPPGLGTQIFRTMIANAKEAGISHIEVQAAGNGNGVDGSDGIYNGYYTWARMGYSSSVPHQIRRGDSEKAKEFQQEFPGVESMRELFATKKGRDWWKLHGIGWSGEFHLEDNSENMRALEGYLRERKAAGREY